CFFAAGTGRNREAFLRQIFGQRLAYERLIVHDQDGIADCGLRIADGCRRFCLPRITQDHMSSTHVNRDSSPATSHSAFRTPHSPRGRRTRNSVPRPGAVSNSTVPPWSATSFRVTNSPSPVPCFLVVKYG